MTGRKMSGKYCCEVHFSDPDCPCTKRIAELEAEVAGLKVDHAEAVAEVERVTEDRNKWRSVAAIIDNEARKEILRETNGRKVPGIHHREGCPARKERDDG